MPALSRWIGRDSVILDVGGHAGQFAKLFARMAPDGRVLAVEPGSYALSILRPAIRFNRIANVTVLPVGVGAEPARLTLSVPVKRSGSLGFGLSHLGAAAGGRDDGRRVVEEVVEVTTVDRLVADHRITRLDFVKADIEGWELRMLAGAARTIESFHPTMLLEVGRANLARAGDTPEALFEHLDGLGYRAYVLGEGLRSFEPVRAPREGDIFFVAERNLDRLESGLRSP